MFGNALHALVGAQAPRLDARGQRQRPAALAGFVVEAAFVAVVAALFLGWLMSGRALDSLSGRGPQCVSFGRGGALCSEAARDASQAPASHQEDNCISLGKGGRLCFARPARAGS
jgi:hypothetical protein